MSKWEYKARDMQNKIHKSWKPCTQAQKEKIEKQYPHKFEFKELVKPEPTPSMKKAQKSPISKPKTSEDKK